MGLSPMMEQYLKIKEQNPDCILFFRLGDFYEMFFEDAKTASEELELVLTGRDCGLEERAPMCGVPFHSCESYIAKLISKGYRVAICEQMEDPATAKTLVNREVIKVITPGTAISDTMLDEARNNYLCTFWFIEGKCGICFVDASTGLLHLTDISGDDIDQRVIGEIGRFMPREIVTADGLETHPELENFLKNRLECRLTKWDKSAFMLENTRDYILKHFNVLTLSALNIPENGACAIALGAAFDYLRATVKTGLNTISEIDYYSDEQYMRLDISAMKNLELCENLRGNGKRGTLLWVLDKTKTAMGKRKLRGMIEQPLMNMSEINTRQNAVDELAENSVMRSELRDSLSGMKDFERMMSRVIYGTANAKELNSLADTVSHLPGIYAQLENANSRFLKSVLNDMDLLDDIYTRITDTIDPDPSSLVREGKIIREGFSKEVDELREILTKGKSYISDIETAEKERTGIKTLKVRYNKVFGYYIEVSNSFKDKVPDNYIRKQTLVNSERFITDELKSFEGKVLGAREQDNQLEFELFDELRRFVASNRQRVMRTADAVARLDAIISLAEVAVNNNYCRPKLNQDGRINITDGRHPVVEQISRDPFVPNDALLDLKDNRCAIITGPNMAGKSTYMRQVALMSVMAQIGSFVPAKNADICICDAVYTRVGASDDLAAGQSTFMVEMSEVAYIIRNATKNSLLILDEIGRGTSTFDGMSIARAVLEYCADQRKLGAKTLFATHYHELTTLEEELGGIKNYNIAVRKHGDDITFLRRIVRGGADDSYGVEVAKLAGIPNNIIKRAREILQGLEKDGITVPAAVKVQDDDYGQISIMQNSAVQLVDDLKLMDANVLTPIEALQRLSEFIDRAKGMN